MEYLRLPFEPLRSCATCVSFNNNEIINNSKCMPSRTQVLSVQGNSISKEAGSKSKRYL